MSHSRLDFADQPASAPPPDASELTSPRSSLMRVSVLVTLERHAEAGGHVKCWEKFAAAAALYPNWVDLTVHFLGEPYSVTPLAGNVRFIHHAPRFSTKRVPVLQNDAG